jgi:hypothetical protein
VATQTVFTDLAEQQYRALHGKQRERVKEFFRDLKARGCGALGYRLTGNDPLQRICVKHLPGPGQLRIVVAFESVNRAWILLVGPHDSSDPGMDVYTALYRLVGVNPPVGKRTKPSCCDDGGEPPILGSVAEELADRAVQLRRRRR